MYTYSSVCEGIMKYHWCLCDCVSPSFHTHSVQQDIQFTFKWLHFPWTNEQLAVNHDAMPLGCFQFWWCLCSPPSTPYRSASGIDYTSKSLSKMAGNSASIKSTVGVWIYYSMSSYNNVMMPSCMQASVFPPNMLYLIVCGSCVIISIHIYISVVWYYGVTIVFKYNIIYNLIM